MPNPHPRTHPPTRTCSLPAETSALPPDLLGAKLEGVIDDLQLLFYQLGGASLRDLWNTLFWLTIGLAVVVALHAVIRCAARLPFGAACRRSCPGRLVWSSHLLGWSNKRACGSIACKRCRAACPPGRPRPRPAQRRPPPALRVQELRHLAAVAHAHVLRVAAPGDLVPLVPAAHHGGAGSK